MTVNSTFRDEVGTGLDLQLDFNVDGYVYGRFAQLVVARGLAHLGSNSWPCEKHTLEGVLDRALVTQRGHGSRSAVVDLRDVVGEGCLAAIFLGTGNVNLRVGARTVDQLASARDWLRERYPVVRPTAEQRIWITFWSLGPHCAREMLRKIDVPTWGQVEPNYPSAVRETLDSLMGSDFKPGLGGRLLLWHGKPGTGKTWALRALGWEWRSWCDFHYVTDPETFFGSSPTYMLDVLLNNESDGEEGEEGRWRLLILEDTGELLAADAKERTGQGLSRLLNVVDGLIGQGLRVLVLVTTNEELRSLHPAVSRPGRCASQLEFAMFTGEEAADWLAQRGSDVAPRPGTLATLYALQSGVEPPEPLPVGFAQ
jgi:hypothetical protein